MLSKIAANNTKTIAWFLFFLFYFEMVGSAFAHSRIGASVPIHYSLYSRSKQIRSSLSTGPLQAHELHQNISDNYQQELVHSKNVTSVQGTMLMRTNDVPDAASLGQTDGPGPGQPEMQSFKSVGADNMVDMFSGDFSYNLPLLDVGGYPIGIHYNGGITMDQEASWVGLGWNINPGVINRSVRGIPDDFDGTDKITKFQNVKMNKTIGGTVSESLELLGKKTELAKFIKGPTVKAGAFYNNYKGWGVEYGVTPSMSTSLFSKGSLTAGLSVSNNSQTGLDISPSFGVGISTKQKMNLGLNANISSNYNSRTGISGLQMGLSGSASKTVVEQIDKDNTQERDRSMGGGYPLAGISFVKPSFSPTISMPYTNESYNFSLQLGVYKKLKLNSYGTISGYTSKNYIAPEDRMQTIAAYGYLNFQKAKEAGNNVLLDFNRDKEVPYRPNTPHIGVPSYTYDVYSISGEGIGGSFRPYRGDIGFVHDHEMRTKSKSGNFGLDLGIGGYVQIGLDIDQTNNQTVTGPWKTGSNILDQNIAFKNEDNTISEPVYFKNPGEKIKVDQSYFEALGDTDLVNINLVGISSKNSPDPVLSNTLNRYKNQVLTGTSVLKNETYRKTRDKRTQVISYLTADLAAKFALDTLIKVYDLNAIPSLGCNTNYSTLKRNEGFRKPNHLSEITVLNSEGKRYVYGIPAYNTVQQETSFAVNKDSGNINTGLVKYKPGIDNSIANDVEKTDNYYNKESTPAFAHSFLLSAILSSDYVDETGNGLSEDDQGDAIKFNYSKVYGEQNGFYRWRAPYLKNTASYSEGLKSDRRDDRGSYTYGEKEVWYLNSVESKNMIGVFVVETDPLKVRKDMFGVKGENGERDGLQNQYQLKEINLYTKADLIKYGIAKARPIKTVHFEYDYSLCKDHPASVSTGIGKLTLRKIWFTYNKNDKGVQNPYVFHYDKDAIDANGNVSGNSGPSYNNKSYDRWGNFKDPAINPGPAGDKLSNADYPYPTQDGTVANDNSAAWSLNEILTPSGAKIKVTYESDDYGFVQNKRAMQMMQVAGFGKTQFDVPQASLYRNNIPLVGFEPLCDYIFIKIPYQINSYEELSRRYFEGISKMLVKFNLKVPSDTWGSGSETVPCYFDIDSYGIKGDPADKVIWIKAREVDGKNAFLLSATQFLKMNLYSKAYPVSEPGDEFTIKTFLTAMGSAIANVKNATVGFYGYTLTAFPARIREVITDKSYARLDNPYYKKYGGGHRVKRVEIFDNFNKMTSGQQKESVYGTEYEYTTKIKGTDGNEEIISSGVATYEPMIGKDENPFNIPADPYKEQVGLLAPTDYYFVDEPIMESFYPSASVGYSKIKARSISRNRKSANGFQVTEFYTSKDFPTQTSYTPLEEGVNRYTYQNPKPSKLSFFNFNPKSYVTLSQGFKVELNDMNGKVRRTSSFAENDSLREVSYTQNYYRLENDRTQTKLSSHVEVIDSANGVVDKNAEMGKEVELMIDLREQLSVTRSSSKQLNLLIQKIPSVPGFIPIPIPIWYKKSEINRYRSAAVTKVINRYGILDSVVVVDKGSKVTTRNMIYDSETGEVLLSRTNNEFDDPVYNFNYPAHWAYSGMASAYKNIQKTLTGQNILNGVLRNRANETFFESGDEIILIQKEPKRTMAGAVITGEYSTRSYKVWAIDAAKGKENNKGIYFIDGNGNAVTTPNNELASMMITRSGKRNLLGAGVGSITALANPVRLVGSDYKIVFDTASRVVAASAGRYKDFWRVDSTVSPVDSSYKVLASASVILPVKRALLLKQYDDNGKVTDYPSIYLPTNISTQMHQIRRGKKVLNALYTKSIIDFDFSTIPADAIITTAKLNLTSMPFRDTTIIGGAYPSQWYYNNGQTPTALDNKYAHYNVLGNGTAPAIGNPITLSRVTTNWDATSKFAEIVSTNANDGVSSFIPGLSSSTSCSSTDVNGLDIKNLIQSIVKIKYASYGILMQMSNYSVNNDRNIERRSRSYYSGNNLPITNTTYNNCYDYENNNMPSLSVSYTYMKDTSSLICRPAIKPEGINPYKFGVLGNWRMDRAYSYYDNRKESDAAVETNIRKNGEIKAFQPYWNFSNNYLKNTTADTTIRWVWNSELTLFNRKGTEVENKDPLNRFNAGQYGYNKNLPIAVTQNSKSRNMAFDGFEDYDYKTSYCEAECQTYQCLPPGYNSVLNNCDTLSNAMTSFTNAYTYTPLWPLITRNASGCDISTWGFGLSPVSNSEVNTTSTAYSFQSMFHDGMVGFPDSGQAATPGPNNLQLIYHRNVCFPSKTEVYEANFQTIQIPRYSYNAVFFHTIVNTHTATDSLKPMQATIAQTGNGSVHSGNLVVSRPDFSFNFNGSFRTLKIVFTIDTIALYVNDTLLGKFSSDIFFPGATFESPTIPALQFAQIAAKIDWVRISDGNGKVVINEQFNGGCTSFAMPTPDFDCKEKPDCSILFTNYFNDRFKTNFNYEQIGTLYAQCNLRVSPCGDTMPSCNVIDTTITRTAGFDRFADFTKGGGVRNTEQRHTGKYSLKIKAGKTAGNVIKISSIADDQKASALSIKIDTVAYTGVSNVEPKGIGLLTSYNVSYAKKAGLFNHSVNGCMNANVNPSNPLWNPNKQYSAVNTDWNFGSPQQFASNQFCATDYFGVEWSGKLQANFTAKHVFRLSKGTDDQVLMYLDNTPVNFRYTEGEWQTDSIPMEACRLYAIRIVYTETLDEARCTLLWSNPYAPEPTVIPIKNFYPPTITAADTAGSCKGVTMVARLNTIKPDNIHNPLFSPIEGTQLLIGAWVRESQTCYTGSYANVGIDIAFGGSSTAFKLRPSGNIIEGWQRIEGIITVPANIGTMNIGLRSLGNTDVYFDDIRIHPFNANMKSYVYNPSNLRLMADLDENNYASFYEYDDDGTLIRVKKETERGIKTIRETRSALYKQ